MEIGEMIAVGNLEKRIQATCPFKTEAIGAGSEELEGPLKDDYPDAEQQQRNNGGILGENLVNASPGASGTVGGPYPPTPATPEIRKDTTRTGVRVRVPGTALAAEGIHGFIVAAHHLIPGGAALGPSALKSYMTKGATINIEVGGVKKSKELRMHIGYNVNGAHNGVWLPGNYYIRSSSPGWTGPNWSNVADQDWLLHYVAAATKAAEGQFHDAHAMYSNEVLLLLNKIAFVLSKHECEQCETPKINAPFQIKNRLYRLSGYFRARLKGHPKTWKRKWFTSDRWREAAFSGGSPSAQFALIYDQAERIDPVI